jgi:hypothetical protein
LEPKDIARDIMNGNSFDRVQRKYGIKMRSQLLDLYAKGLAELEEIPHLDTASSSKVVPAVAPQAKARRTIGNSGTITLTKSLLISDFGFREGDQFAISRKGNTIVLEKIY